MSYENPSADLHQQTVEILSMLVDVLTTEDMTILCIACGVRTNELMSEAI